MQKNHSSIGRLYIFIVRKILILNKDDKLLATHSGRRGSDSWSSVLGILSCEVHELFCPASPQSLLTPSLAMISLGSFLRQHCKPCFLSKLQVNSHLSSVHVSLLPQEHSPPSLFGFQTFVTEAFVFLRLSADS